MQRQDENCEPDWLDPKNDRSTPYTDEELDLLVQGFIDGHPEHYEQLVKNDGPNTARIVLRNRFRARDPNSPSYRGDLLDI